MSEDVAAIAKGLTEAQRRAVAWFSPGGFVVGFRPEWAGLDENSFDALDGLGLIVKHWTWASTTRPDTGLSNLGLAVKSHLEQQG